MHIITVKVSDKSLPMMLQLHLKQHVAWYNFSLTLPLNVWSFVLGVCLDTCAPHWVMQPNQLRWWWLAKIYPKSTTCWVPRAVYAFASVITSSPQCFTRVSVLDSLITLVQHKSAGRPHHTFVWHYLKAHDWWIQLQDCVKMICFCTSKQLQGAICTIQGQDQIKYIHCICKLLKQQKSDMRNPPRLLLSSEECAHQAWITPAWLSVSLNVFLFREQGLTSIVSKPQTHSCPDETKHCGWADVL